ncbi:hypothetical protein OG762_12175 [Streptomyces sp. NBC_01136]|nr:hypothetical protein OG762_12175 [Streptomyces sp. NBC_01136]
MNEDWEERTAAAWATFDERSMANLARPALDPEAEHAPSGLPAPR